MPELGLGNLVACISLQVLPPSADQVSVMTFCLLRHSAWILPPGWVNRAGWMAPNDLLLATGPTRTQLLPRSGVISKWTRQPLSSVLLPHRMAPPGSWSG